MLLALTVHPIVSPGAFILSSIWHVENSPTVSLAIPVLPHIPHELGIQRNTKSRHLVVLKHALIAKIIIKELRADSMHFVSLRLGVKLDLAIINMIPFLDSDELILDVTVRIYVNLGRVIVHDALRVRDIPESELDLIDGLLNLWQQLVSFVQIPLLRQNLFEVLDRWAIEEEIEVLGGLTFVDIAGSGVGGLHAGLRELLDGEVDDLHEVLEIRTEVLQNLNLGELVDIFLGLLVLLHRLVHLAPQRLELELVVDEFPVLVVLEHGIVLVDLLLELLLVVVNVFVHFTLGLQEHVAQELLNPTHHELGLYLEVILLAYYVSLVFIIHFFHFDLPLFDSFEEFLGVLLNIHDSIFVTPLVIRTYSRSL